jgi:glycine/D-amino acid oxidase-like deaminating enzyme
VQGDTAHARLLEQALIRPDARALIEEVQAGHIDPHAAAATLAAALRIIALKDRA